MISKSPCTELTSSDHSLKSPLEQLPENAPKIFTDPSDLGQFYGPSAATEGGGRTTHGQRSIRLSPISRVRLCNPGDPEVSVVLRCLALDERREREWV